MKRATAIIVLITVVFALLSAFAEDRQVFILCDPETPVNVRRTPKKGAEVSGRLDFGDEVETDGLIRNGYLHVIGITEDGEGWIFAGYVVDDPPVKLERAMATVASNGRVMAHRWIGGKRKCWLKVETDLRVYAISDEWAVTEKGYVRTEYLEVWYE